MSLGKPSWEQLFPLERSSVSSRGRRREEKEPGSAIAALRAQPLSKCHDLVR